MMISNSIGKERDPVRLERLRLFEGKLVLPLGILMGTSSLGLKDQIKLPLNRSTCDTQDNSDAIVLF